MLTYQELWWSIFSILSRLFLTNFAATEGQHNQKQSCIYFILFRTTQSEMKLHLTLCQFLYILELYATRNTPVSAGYFYKLCCA